MKKTLILVPLLMFCLTYAHEDQDKEKTYDTIDKSKLCVSEKGLAPLNVKNGKFELSYKGSVTNWVDIFKLYARQDGPFTLEFINGICVPPFKPDNQEKLQLVYTKISDDVALIALEREKFGQHSIQYFLRFLEKNTGIATLLILDEEGLSRVIANIRFKWLPSED